MNIFLTGFMASGKTTYGRALAKAMNRTFVDLDEVIEATAGKSIAEIFSAEGEAAFRKMERMALLELKLKNGVVATGGGTACFADNMEYMNASGLTLYLKVPLQEIARRAVAEKNVRPLLENRTGNDLIALIAAKLREREAYYLQSAIILDPLHVSEKDLAKLLLARIDDQSSTLPL
ncbi:MAG: shikimate kinase [Bacteroidia bacterium]